MKIVSQRVYIADMDTIKMCIYVLEIKSFAEIVHGWVDAVDKHKKLEFYSIDQVGVNVCFLEL